jgi:hypothetical protein
VAVIEHRNSDRAAGPEAMSPGTKLQPSLYLCSKSRRRTAAERTGGKGVIAEADKMLIERTDDFVGYTIAGNNPHLNQPETK